MKILNGQELASFIQERQVKQVRTLRQAKKIVPKLAIILCNDNPVSIKYAELKKAYGKDILVEVEVYKTEQAEVIKLIKKLNTDSNTHGIIVQLPLSDPTQTDVVIETVSPDKDVDGLNPKSYFDAATPMAIMWLLTGYNIDLAGKAVAIIGRGRLVGAPLNKLLENSGVKAEVVHSQTKNTEDILLNSHVIISAVGKPGVITASMIPENAVVIDAGTATDNDEIKGDLADDVYEREDLILTPKIGGIGPLTVCALFDNLIRAAQIK